MDPLYFSEMAFMPAGPSSNFRPTIPTCLKLYSGPVSLMASRRSKEYHAWNRFALPDL